MKVKVHEKYHLKSFKDKCLIAVTVTATSTDTKGYMLYWQHKQQLFFKDPAQEPNLSFISFITLGG